MMNKDMMGRCGCYCGSCDWAEKTNCPGCQKAKGDMFWGKCTVAKCSTDKGLDHCGGCAELPCPTLQEAFDNPDHGDDGERLANLKAWADGKNEYIEIGEFKKDEE